jgi:hypothetical protein
LEQAAADFGVYLVALSKWMRRADVHDGTIREPAVADPSFGNCGAATVCSSRGTKFAPGGSVSVASSSSGKRWLYRVIDSLVATGAAVDPILSPPGSRPTELLQSATRVLRGSRFDRLARDSFRLKLGSVPPHRCTSIL